jgi:hypothetical protein
VLAQSSGLVSAAVDAFRDAYQLGLFPLIGELGRVLQDQNRPFTRIEPSARRLEMRTKQTDRKPERVAAERLPSALIIAAARL